MKVIASEEEKQDAYLWQEDLFLKFGVPFQAQGNFYF